MRMLTQPRALLGAVTMSTPPRSVRGERPAGYMLGSASVPRAPLSVHDVEKIKGAMLWTNDDVEALRQLATALEPRVDELVDTWYAIIGRNPDLVETFAGPNGRPNEEYLAAVKPRFAQWVRDTLAARHDQAWVDYQFEVGRRHHRTAKNRTDGVRAADIVPFRYMPALVPVVVDTVRPLIEREASREEVDRMLLAWHKAVQLQVILWSHPYVKDGDF